MIKATLISICLFLSISSANAVQLGFGLGLASGDGDITDDFATYSVDTDARLLSFALNACEDCGVFNYRLHAGYEFATYDFPFGFKEDYEGISVANTFGFKVVNQDQFKLWLGASVHASVMLLDGYDEDDADGIVYFGFGPTVGLDVGIGQSSTLSFELSIRDLNGDSGDDFVEDADIEDVVFQVSFLF